MEGLEEVICRLCANPSDKIIGIYSEEGVSNDLAGKMNLYLPIKVAESDHLPLNSCWNCASTVLAWHELVLASVEADRRLRNDLIVDYNKMKYVIDEQYLENQAEDQISVSTLYVKANKTSEENSVITSLKLDEVEQRANGYDVLNVEKECEAISETNYIYVEAESAAKRKKTKKANPKKISKILYLCESSDKSKNLIMFEEQNTPKLPEKADQKIETTEINNKSAAETTIKITKEAIKHGNIGSNSFIVQELCLDENDLIYEANDNNLESNKDLQFVTSAKQTEKSNKISECLEELEEDIVSEEEQYLMTEYQEEFESNNGEFTQESMDGFETNEVETVDCNEEELETFKTLLKTCEEEVETNAGGLIEVMTVDNNSLSEQDDDGTVKSKKASDDKKKGSHKRKYTKSDQLMILEARMEVEGKVYYNCKMCDKKLHSPYTFLWHTRIHTGERPFVCDLCGKQFRVSQGLVRHLRDTHEGVKNHACDVCGRMFASKRNVEEHRRVHTNERPYVCALCGKAFRQKASLFVHNRSHLSTYKYHCDICKHGFKSKGPLLLHRTKHTGEKPHKCEVCGRGFRIKYELKRHQLIHSDDKPFVCTACGCSFRQKRYLKNHIKLNHKELEIAEN